ncbi:MAG: PEP-CTERM sorting domain-containing protein [Planctomycetota bacterium]
MRTALRIAPSAGVLAAAVLASAPAFGAVTVFGPTGPTDGTEADFDAATSTTAVDLAGGPAAGTTLEVVGGIDDTGGGTPAIAPIAFDDFTLDITGNNNTFDDSFVSTATELGLGLFSGEHESAVLSFPTPLTAFAATFESPASSNGLEVTIDGVEVDTFPLFLAGGGQGQQFLGFISDTPFSTVTITSSFGGETFFLDNIEVEVVPEPASLALLGLGGLMAARRRRA